MIRSSRLSFNLTLSESSSQSIAGCFDLRRI